ncbi:hypothetical protein J6590_062702 [Homalodisca vitripennis]|nr:hypothetical protein J6590_062702 [Homalodisca vitripennis]
MFVYYHNSRLKTKTTLGLHIALQTDPTKQTAMKSNLTLLNGGYNGRKRQPNLMKPYSDTAMFTTTLSAVPHRSLQRYTHAL